MSKAGSATYLGGGILRPLYRGNLPLKEKGLIGGLLGSSDCEKVLTETGKKKPLPGRGQVIMKKEMNFAEVESCKVRCRGVWYAKNRGMYSTRLDLSRRTALFPSL